MSTRRPYNPAEALNPARALDPDAFARDGARRAPPPPPPRNIAGGTVAPATEPAPRDARRRATSPRATIAEHPSRTWLVLVAALAALAVYLFVTAPPPLSSPSAAGTAATAANALPVRTVFAMLEAENDAARALWTEDIVNRGAAAGLAFDERWRDPAVHAGPLPALFLRETARNLERTPLRLSLFLGSQYPINAANQLSGQQASELAVLAASGAPRYFYEPAIGLHAAMFPDRAVVAACVTCHNEHADSPKTDWKLGDVMGATTWLYPEATVPTERAVAMLGALRSSIRAAYVAYLDEVATFAEPPEIGERWPRDGRYLPSADAFMRELARRASPATVRALVDPAWAEQLAATGDAELPVPEAGPPPPPPPPTTTTTSAPPVPSLVVRSLRPTLVTVSRGASRLLVARLPAGTAASLQALPPLTIRVADPTAIEVEYGGARVTLPTASTAEDEGEVEVVVDTMPGKT